MEISKFVLKKSQRTTIHHSIIKITLPEFVSYCWVIETTLRRHLDIWTEISEIWLSYFRYASYPTHLILTDFAWPPIPSKIAHHLCMLPRLYNSSRLNPIFIFTLKSLINVQHVLLGFYLIKHVARLLETSEYLCLSHTAESLHWYHHMTFGQEW